MWNPEWDYQFAETYYEKQERQRKARQKAKELENNKKTDNNENLSTRLRDERHSS